MKRNHFIDLLRFIAAVSVMLHHQYLWLQFRPDNFYAFFFKKYGHLGVPVFFVISGYCMMIALNHAKRPSDFIVRRFFRIFPAYWFSLLLALFVLFLLRLITGANSVAILPKSPGDILLTLSILTSPLTTVKPIVSVYWTLTLELGFYIIIFLCSLLNSLLKRDVLIFSLIAITLMCYFVPVRDHGVWIIFRYWPIFSAGAALYKLLHEAKSQKPLNFIYLGFSLAGLYPAEQDIANCITTVLTISVIAFFYTRPIVSNRFQKWGDLSYSIYLIHMQLTVFWFWRYRDYGPLQGNGILNFLADIVALAVILTVSAFVYKYIELPAIALAKSITSKKPEKIQSVI